MSAVIKRVRERFPRIPTLLPRVPKGPIISIVAPQPYDPELAAIDEGGLIESRRRLGLGYGAPPVVPYAQKMMGLGIRKKVLETFPMLNKFPMVKRALEA